MSPRWPTSPEYYNSAIVVNRDGETIANYRKSFLWATDEKWALEGTDGFFYSEMPDLGPTAMGIGESMLLSYSRHSLAQHNQWLTVFGTRHGFKVCPPYRPLE